MAGNRTQLMLKNILDDTRRLSQSTNRSGDFVLALLARPCLFCNLCGLVEMSTWDPIRTVSVGYPMECST